MAIYHAPHPVLDSDPETKAATCRDLLTLKRRFLREEGTAPDDLAAAIGFVLDKAEFYLLAPKDTLFRLAYIVPEAGPTGERPARLYLNIGRESDLTIDHLSYARLDNWRVSNFSSSYECEYDTRPCLPGLVLRLCWKMSRAESSKNDG